MRFYSDRQRRVAPRSAAGALRERLRLAAALPRGPARHGALAALLVSAGELTQGIADAERAIHGADVLGAGERRAAAVTLALARALWRSWQSGGATGVPAPGAVEPLLALALPEVVKVRRAEGFALYGLYPETYAAAATALAGALPAVVGIRSIGTALAAMVAAGSRAAGVPISVRPDGHPFRRVLRLAPALARRLAARGGPVAVVDEGPGLSGSSFVAVADALAAAVPADRLRLFPSHPGPPGSAAAPEVRARYEGLARYHVPFEALFLSDAPLALGRLVEDLVGPVDGAPLDLSAGAWRPVLLADPRTWPPSEGWRERRKYLLHASGRGWVARFAGLGEAGERALSRARRLAAAGLVPAPAGLRHGFLVEAFETGARPLTLARLPRARLLAAVRRHVTQVASLFPCPTGGEGASPRELAEVAVESARELLPGTEAAREVARAAARFLPEVERLARPVAVDGRLQRWEWLVRRDGSVVKTDALDHHCDHALVGCQDALWDVAGATLELALDAGEAADLAVAVRTASPGAPPRCLPFFLVVYAAFEAGRWAAAAAEPGTSPEEAARRRAEAIRLAGALRRVAGATGLERVDPRGTPGG